MIEWLLAPRFFNLRRGLLMLVVVGLHAVIGGVWAQHSQANISFGQPVIEMTLEFSSVDSNTSEQLQSEQSKSEQAIQSLRQEVAEPEPAPVLKPESKSEPKPEQKTKPKEDLNSKSMPKSTFESKLQPQPEIQVKKQTKKTVHKKNTNQVTTQKNESSQINSSTGTQRLTVNHASVPAQLMNISQLIFEGNPPVPHYPKRSRLNGEEGLVVVRISIDRLGGVERSQVIQSSGFEALDHAALDAITKIRFKPYQINTMSHRVMVDIPFNFILSP